MLDFETELVWISDRYQTLFGQFGPRQDHFLIEIITPAIEAIAHSDAPYHTLEHTLQVMKVGQFILEGKQHQESTVSPKDWLHFMVALLCHDIGYVKGIFERDYCHRHQYFNGKGGWVTISSTATGAALTDCHVDRSKAYVSMYLNHPHLDIHTVQHYVEVTRFPIPNETIYQSKLSYGGLCRAADLLGQLSDPCYLEKLPALFQEFEETGMNQILGYTTHRDLKAGYPQFFWNVVYPYIKPSLRYFGATPESRKVITSLFTNLCLAELDQPPSDVTDETLQQLKDDSELRPWQEAGFTFL